MTTIFYIQDFGAIADGKTYNTEAFKRCIETAHAHGGGIVVVSSGIWRTGTIRLLSNVTLKLCPGAVILGADTIEHYADPLTFGHHNDITPWHLIQAKDAENISIVGEGTINGCGPSFWESARPHEESFWKEKTIRPSPMVHFENCRYVRIESVRLIHSAGWTLHLHDCVDSIIRGLFIENTPFGPNTDGIDITGGKRLVISDCIIDTGDDGIALKTNEYSTACEEVSISNCVIRTSCVAIRIGHESRQDFRDIAVSNIVSPKCSRVLDLRSLEGGVIERISFSNIIGTTNSGWPVNRPIEVSLHSVPNVYKSNLIEEHHDYGKDKPLTRKGRIRDIIFRDIMLTTDGRITVVADDDHEISNIIFDGVRIRYTMLDDSRDIAKGGSPSYLFGAQNDDAREALAAIVAKNVTHLSVRNLSIFWPEYPVQSDWKLLTSPNRMIARSVYDGHEESIRNGSKRVEYKVLWAKHVSGKIEIGTLLSSEGIESFTISDSNLEIL